MVMNPKTYERVTTACLVAAIASALLFEHSGQLKVLTGALGIVAAIAAASVYFHNLWSNDRCQDDNDKQAPAVIHVFEDELEEERKQRAEVLHAEFFDLARSEVLHAKLVRNWYHHSQRRWGFVVAEATKEPSCVTERVVEIVERLSAHESMRSYEFVLSPDGRFTIRPLAHRRPSPIDEQVASAEAEHMLSPIGSFKVH